MMRTRPGCPGTRAPSWAHFVDDQRIFASFSVGSEAKHDLTGYSNVMKRISALVAFESVCASMRSWSSLEAGQDASPSDCVIANGKFLLGKIAMRMRTAAHGLTLHRKVVVDEKRSESGGEGAIDQ